MVSFNRLFIVHMLKYTTYNIYTLLNILAKQFNTLSPMLVVFVRMVGQVGQVLFDMQLNSVERKDKPSKHYQIKTFYSFCTYYDSTIRLVYQAKFWFVVFSFWQCKAMIFHSLTLAAYNIETLPFISNVIYAFRRWWTIQWIVFTSYRS